MTFESVHTRVTTILASLLVAAVAAPSGFAQVPETAIELQSKIGALQGEVQTLQGQATLRTPLSSPPEAPATRTIEERLEELAAQIRILARQIELDKEQAAEKAKQTPQPAAGQSGFSIQSPDGAFKVRLRGLVHSDGRFFMDDAAQSGVDTFHLRRIRPFVEATLYGQFDLRIMPDFAGGSTVLQDAYLDARLHPLFKIRAGKFKAPVGLERLVSASDLTFIERALPTLLVPNRDVGIMVHGDVLAGRLSYAAGLFNGVPDGGSADFDIQNGKDVVARLFAQPFRADRGSIWQGLGAGVAVSYGSHRGVSAAVTGLASLRTSGQQTFFGYGGDDPATGPVLADGAHSRVSAQGHYYYGSFGLLAEHVLSSQEIRRSTVEATLRNSAWQAAGSWVLTGEAPTYRGVVPRTPFDLRSGSGGAVELTARYSALRIDDDTFPRFANPNTAASGADAWALGVNWILNTGVKLQVNYEQTAFDTAGSVRRPTEHGVLTRLQFGF